MTRHGGGSDFTSRSLEESTEWPPAPETARAAALTVAELVERDELAEVLEALGLTEVLRG